MTSQKINPSFRILSAFAIIFVVAGHADFGVFDIAGMFPYYSFHVGVFAFVSGYFYREESEANIKNYLLKKAKHLLLPYFGWNLFYGLFTTLLRYLGFGIGNPITLKTFFIDPFLGGHQYGLNFAAWFVPVLFIIEVANVFMRKVLDIIHFKKEWLIFTFSLLAGMVVVWLSIRGSVWGYYRHIGCILFLFPIFQGGQFYKKVLENYIDKKWYTKTENGLIITKDNKRLVALCSQTQFENSNCIVPNGIEIIGASAFSGSTISYIHIPSTCIELESLVFQNSSIEAITLPYSVNKIGVGIFFESNKLQLADFSQTSITNIPMMAFYSCSKLRTIIMPGEYTKEQNAFYMCSPNIIIANQ